MTNITLSSQQKTAIDKLASWYSASIRDKKTFILNGHAGTGKTTISRMLPELVLNAEPVTVVYTALTGKAVLQLRKVGCQRTTTLHKLLYAPLEKDRTRLLELTAALRAELNISPAGDSDRAKEVKRQLYLERRQVAQPSWQAKRVDLPPEVKLIVVDESSMVDPGVYNDLMALDIPLVFIGDPFQLPPVFGVSPIMEQEPDYVLTEVHRQALDNPVLLAATELRAGRYPSLQPGQDKFQVVPVKDATYELYASVDQVLCGRNKTRRSLNAKMRKRLVESGKVARSELPAAVGDKVVFLRNDHEEQIFNGTLAELTSVTSGVEEGHENLIIDGVDDAGNAICAYEVWGGVLEGLEAHEAPRRAQLIDHALALTVHKSQGSEWPSVLVHSEAVGHGTDALRWLYTAITRAQNKCIVVTRED